MRPWVGPLVWRLGLLLPWVVQPAWQGLDAMGHHWMFQLRGPLPSPQGLVVLAIDEASLDPGISDLGPWPWPREQQAALAAHVLEQGANRVVFNIVHSGPSRFGAEDDQAFAARLKPWRDRIVMSASYVQERNAGVELVQLRRPMAEFAPVGLSSFVLDLFGVVSAVPGAIRTKELMEGFQPPHPIPLAHLAADVPLQPWNQGINFLGPAGQSGLVVPAWRVGSAPAAVWRNKTVVFGATAPSLGDQLETPYGQLSGSELMLAAIAGLEQGRGFRSLPRGPLLVFGLLWIALCNWRIASGRTGVATALISLALIGLAGAIAALAWLAGWWIPGTALLLTPLIGGGSRTASLIRQESVQRRFLHSVLSRRVSPNLMRDMLRSRDQLWTQLGGRRVRCVVLFTDLVGFTARSSVMEPEALFSLMNRYFEAIAAPVLEQQGLLDKFIGDALMAEFGVPQHRGDRVEALAAAHAALAMQANLAQLNLELKAAGEAPLMQGIGIHFGDVMAGNLGSSHRLEYTVIGASVNLASRLESLTRTFPDHPILISRDVRDLLGDAAQVQHLGRHCLKGWPEPVEVFGLSGLNPTEHPVALR